MKMVVFFRAGRLEDIWQNVFHAVKTRQITIIMTVDMFAMSVSAATLLVQVVEKYLIVTIMKMEMPEMVFVQIAHQNIKNEKMIERGHRKMSLF